MFAQCSEDFLLIKKLMMENAQDLISESVDSQNQKYNGKKDSWNFIIISVYLNISLS